MERTRNTHWLIVQGYRLSTIPPVVTWYVADKNTGKERELRGRTDDYTLNLYRSKGFVLDKKYLDPQLWHELEYVAPSPRMAVEPPRPPRTTPRLAKAIKGAVGERDSWEGTATELLSLIGEANEGIPTTAVWLSIEVMKPHITDALKTYALTVERKRTASTRLLRLAPAGLKLVLTEGIEDGLIVMQETDLPAWAAMSHANLSSLELPPLPLAQEITIAADNDDMGITSAKHAAKAMTLQWREVRIAIPPEGKDFNEMHLAESGSS